MRYRKLQIAWSVAWGVVAVLLCVLWVRSYWWADAIWYRSTNSIAFRFMSDQGVLTFVMSDQMALGLMGDPPPVGWSHHGYWLEGYRRAEVSSWFTRVFRGFNDNTRFTRQAPYWLVLSLSILAAGIVWLRNLPKRFSLRTLLIATTIVAVGLGIAAYMLRK